jgi:hypothetical protein
MAYNSTSWTTDGSTTSVSVGNYSLYAYFGINETISQSYANNIHYAMPFQPGPPMASSVADVDIGTSTDPDTSFTTANTDTQYSGQIISMMWYVPDNIIIDSVRSLQGSDNSSADTTRMHLMSYDYTANSTSTLTNGAVLASSADVEVENTKSQLTTWTLSSNSVSAGKVILATFRKDDDNGNHSINVIVKYHLI